MKRFAVPSFLARAFLAVGACVGVSGCESNTSSDETPSSSSSGSSGGTSSSGGAVAPVGCTQGTSFDQAAMRAALTYLAHPDLGGRVPGTEGDRLAREFVAGWFQCIGLANVGDIVNYQQPFTDHFGATTANVLGMIPGMDAQVGAETIIVTAHIDHLGEGRLGANDDASGVVALMQIAAAMKSTSLAPRRNIIFLVTGSEEARVPNDESSLMGSAYFYAHPPAGVDKTRIVYSINMDMVGTYSQAEATQEDGVGVDALGSFNGTTATTILDSLTSSYPMLKVGKGIGSESSDQATFCNVGIPYLFFWTFDGDLESGTGCYHRTCDTADRIDFPAMAQIANLVSDIIRNLANSTDDLAAGVMGGTNVCLAGP